MNTLRQLIKKTVVLLCIIFFGAYHISAQDKQQQSEFQPHFQVGINGGTSLFFGDIKQYQWWPSDDYVSERNLGGGIVLSYQAKPSISIRLQGLYGQLSGTRREWNTYFKNDYFETNINTVINFNNLFGKYRQNRLFSIYGTVGMGLVQYNTSVKVLNTDEVIKQVGHGNGSGINGRTLQGILTYGLGLNFNVNNNWDIQIETANRMMDSDMLDGRTSGYPLDVYNYTSLGVTYKFGFIKQKQVEEIIEEESSLELAYIPVIIDEVENDTAIVDDIILETAPDEIIEEELVEAVETVEKPEIEYRVQILAKFNGPLSIDYISTKFIIPKYELKQEIYNGHFIYTVGSFKTYEEARNKRDEIRRLYDLTDAFIVVFDKGSRLDTLPQVK